MNNKVEYVKDYDGDTLLFKSSCGYFAKRGRKVTNVFKQIDSLLFLLEYGKIRWQEL